MDEAFGRPTIPSSACIYSFVCINLVSLYNNCILLYCMMLYIVWPLTHCIAFSSLDAAVIVL